MLGFSCMEPFSRGLAERFHLTDAAFFENVYPWNIKQMPAANPQLRLTESLDRDPVCRFPTGPA